MEIVTAMESAFLGNLNEIFDHFASRSGHGDCSSDRACFSR